MSEELTGLKGTVSDQAPVGTICEGKIISVSRGIASEYMTPEQCAARKTTPDTPFMGVEIGIAEYGVIMTKTFRDYSGKTGKDIISPNTYQGQLISSYPSLNKGDSVNVIAGKKETSDGTMRIWKIVLAG